MANANGSKQFIDAGNELKKQSSNFDLSISHSISITIRDPTIKLIHYTEKMKITSVADKSEILPIKLLNIRIVRSLSAVNFIMRFLYTTRTNAKIFFTLLTEPIHISANRQALVSCFFQENMVLGWFCLFGPRCITVVRASLRHGRPQCCHTAATRKTQI